jgi:hypothetical protein
LPSLTEIADSTLALVKATPRGDITLARPSRTCCCVTLTAHLLAPYRSDCIRTGRFFCFDAFSSREPGGHFARKRYR